MSLLNPKIDVPQQRELVVEAALRDLVVGNRILAQHGVLDAFGHVSVRHPLDPSHYLMACSRGPALVAMDDMIEYQLDGTPIDQRGRPQYSERAIHGSIYQARPEVMAVVHHHSPATIPFGVTGTPVRPIFHMASVIGSEIPIWDIADEFGDTNLLVTRYDVGASLAKALGERRVVIMRGHGGAVAGSSLKEAVFVSVYLQVNSELLLSAHQLGTVKYLTDGEVELASDILLQPLGIERAWQTWAHAAGVSDR
jgi:ribulose-5-phosphate 4-epimerase/fuculose-1-phosphate aldolase